MKNKLVILLILLMSIGGCGLFKSPVEIVFMPEGRLIQYRQAFTHAFAAPAEKGGLDLVLVKGFIPESVERDGRVYPATARLARHIMHIHVAWQPAKGSQADFPAASNASIRYHVIADVPGGSPARVSYMGVGFVSVATSKQTSNFMLRDMKLRPVEQVGDIHDPIGIAHAGGQIEAVNDARTVRRLLQELEQELSLAAAAEGSR